MPQSPLQDPPGLWRVLGVLRAIPIALVLFSALIVFNLLQTSSLLLLPFSRRAFRALNRWCANTWWGWCVGTAKLLYGTRIDVSGDELPMREHVILLSNHQQMSDITFLFFLGRSKDRLGDLKWFVKDIIKYVPGVGWGMLFLDCIFVKRNWTADRTSIEQTFSRINQGHVPLWLMNFPEGTRISPRKLERSNDFASKKGLAPLKHLLIPRTRGFTASVEGLRGHLHAVYDVTIGYAEGVPSLWQYIKGYAKVAHMHVRRFTIEELPEAEDALAHWLQERWQEKDRLLEHFYTHGEFPAASLVPVAGAEG